jgi:hypothetical protein
VRFDRALLLAAIDALVVRRVVRAPIFAFAFVGFLVVALRATAIGVCSLQVGRVGREGFLTQSEPELNQTDKPILIPW